MLPTDTLQHGDCLHCSNKRSRLCFLPLVVQLEADRRRRTTGRCVETACVSHSIFAKFHRSSILGPANAGNARGLGKWEGGAKLTD